jgi:transcriptional regulator with GAF, ATPase, and Fis domain
MKEYLSHPHRPIGALAEFLERLEIISEPAALFDYTCSFLAGWMSATFVSILMFDLPGGRLLEKHIYTKSTRLNPLPSLLFRKELDEYILQRGLLLTCDQQRAGGYLLLMDQEDGPWQSCELHLPVFQNRERFLVISLGAKETGSDYSLDELDGLRILATLLTQKAAAHPPNSPVAVPEPGHRLRPIRRVDAYAEIIGGSPAIREIKQLISQISATDASVLLTGESGTGKELVARAIHRSSRRREKCMVVMNCASIPETLVESELFGHEKGAFTGALYRRKGKFEFADGSTLFLDEIGDMSLATQAKLLRVLQDGVFERVGGQSSQHADVRLISATNKIIADLIRQGAFREDLFFRINLLQIEIPPLRERRQDIPLLIDFFFKQFNEKYQAGLSSMHAELYGYLLEYDFPGNVRELRNLVERAVIFNGNPEAIRRMMQAAAASPAAPGLRLDDLERQHIQSVLQMTDYNKSEAARMLGIARKTLREKLSRYSLQ